MRVLVDTPNFFIRPDNTDWKYTHTLSGLSNYVQIETRYPNSFLDSSYESFRYIYRRMGLDIGGSRTIGPLQRGRLPFSTSGCDVVFNHRQLPRNCELPIVWMFSILDHEMLMAYGLKEAEIAKLYEQHAEDFNRAAIVQLCTTQGISRHSKALGMPKERFSDCPFFLPHLNSITTSELEIKHRTDDGIINILFVGHEARRKGLPNLLKSIEKLPSYTQKKINLTVVSALSDISRSELTTPGQANLNWFKKLPREQTIGLFRNAHVYAMPSVFESYGFTFMEAMSTGCAIIAPNWEPQRDILDNGKCGKLVDPFLPICAALEAFMDKDERLRIAPLAIERFKNRFCPTSVANSHFDMFEKAMNFTGR